MSGVPHSTLAVSGRLINQRKGTIDRARSGITAVEIEGHHRTVVSWWWCRCEPQDWGSTINIPRVLVLRRIAVFIDSLYKQRVVALCVEGVERQ